MPRTGSAATVTEIYRYPVKSMGGERLTSARLNGDRLRGDRAYAVHDPDGRLGSGKTTRRFRRMDGLLDFRAGYDGDVPVLTFPGGRALRADDPGVDAALTAELGLPVRLSTERGTSHLDAAPVHVLTTASLRWIAAQLPDVPLTVARFRPNILVDVDGDEPVEDAWVGRRLRIGGVELTVTGQVERCVMANAAQPGLPHDNRVLKTLSARHDMMLGVYTDVRTPGVVTTGDTVEIG